MNQNRRFCSFVLGYIKKHGDTIDHDEATRMLSELEELDHKSQEVAVQVVETDTEEGGSSDPGVSGESIGQLTLGLGSGEPNGEEIGDEDPAGEETDNDGEAEEDTDPKKSSKEDQ